MTARWAAAAFVAWTCAAALHAQGARANLDHYDQAVRAFAASDGYARALEPLLRFASKDFDAAAERIAARKDRAFIEAAAVFQLAIGIGVLDVSANAASGHFALGRWLLQQLAPPEGESGPAHEDYRALCSTWYWVAGSAFIAIADTANAKVWIDRALEVRPNAAAAHTLVGAAHELEASRLNTEILPKGSERTRTQAERQRRYALAEQSFRMALAADSSYRSAEIRLGRVMFLRGQAAEARAVLEAAESHAEDPADRYLAALFLGAAYQQIGDVAAARAAYARALDAMPGSQVAVVALSHLEATSGEPGRAREWAQHIGSFDPFANRHWREYRGGGVDEKGLAWLRARVRR